MDEGQGGNYENYPEENNYGGYAEQDTYSNQEEVGEANNDFNIGIRDLEEKQRILKDRLILIGENLIEIKETTDKKILEIKKDIEIIKQNMDKTINFLETISSEFPKFAKKEDLDILIKQAKMFQPLEFVRKKDFKK